jgi:hypothetical protein
MSFKSAVIAGTVALGAIVGQYGITQSESPFFCNLQALSAAERNEHLQLTRRLAESILKTMEVLDGYAFEVDRHRMSMKDLAAWTEFERRCCPFFDFTLELRRENGPLTFQLTGRDGVKEFIRAEFPQNPR